MDAFKTFLCILFLSKYITAKALNTEGSKANSDPVYRLPLTIVPTYYYISYTMNSEMDEYNGYVFLHFDVAENVSSVNEIYLHADLNFLTIGQILLNNVRLCGIGNRYEADILLIDCYNMDIIGRENILLIEFSGKFSTEDGFGLVKTSYWDQGTDHILIESNFKPTYARRAFPCMDEPDFKASFSLDVTYPAEYKLISNTPVLIENSGPTMKTTEFEKTPKISTYLLSIFLSNLMEANSSSGDDYEVKIFARTEVANMNITAIAGTYSSKIIEQLINYTGVPYKNGNATETYQVALPNYYSDEIGDFGLFTYSESELLDEGDKTSARVKQNIIRNIAYKLSHEWYGGDVSTKWWSDVWANEAVAIYFEYIIPDQVDEGLELTNQFIVEVIQKALQHDALLLAQPLSSIESNVNVFRDIENKLDSFSYLKGACILHMIKYVLRGEENLKSALQYHWKQRQDSNSDTNGQDILRDLVISQDREKYYPYLETWAFSPGFPLITAKLLESDYDDVEITQLSQKRFVYPMNDSSNYDNDRWDIPLTSTSQGEKLFNKTLDLFFQIDDDLMYFGGSNIWLLFNLDGGSFYRVNYEEQLWRRFINYLKSDERAEMEVLNRARLVDDIFNIARIGDVSYALAFELADFLVNETEYYPWYSALNAFSYLLGKLEDDGVEANLKKYILNLMDNEVYIPSDVASYNFAHVDLLKTVMILKWACDLGHDGCLTYTANKFKSFTVDQTRCVLNSKTTYKLGAYINSLSPGRIKIGQRFKVEFFNDSYCRSKLNITLKDYNFRELIFCNGIRQSENILEDWTFLLNVYVNSTSVHERIDILNALGCVEDKELLLLHLQRIISVNSGITKQDALVVFKSVFSNSYGLNMAMEFLQDNLAYIASFYKGVDVLAEMLYAVSEKLITDEHIEWIKGIVNNRVFNSYEDVKSKAIVLVSVNNYWKNHYQTEVKNIFAPPATTTIGTTTSTASSTTTTKGSTTGITSPTTPTTTESSCEKLFLSKFFGALVLLILLVL